MSGTFVLNAEARQVQGKGASRRLRRENKIPAIVYGAGVEPQNITLKQNEVQRNLQEEAFYSQIISLNVGEKSEMVILRDLQRHPSKPFVLHVDLQRVKDDEALTVYVPLHFINASQSVAVKTQGAKVNKIMNSVEIICLPKDLPQFIEVDLANVQKGQILHLSDIQLPENIMIPALVQGEDHNQPIAAIS